MRGNNTGNRSNVAGAGLDVNGGDGMTFEAALLMVISFELILIFYRMD